VLPVVLALDGRVKLLCRVKTQSCVELAVARGSNASIAGRSALSVPPLTDRRDQRASAVRQLQGFAPTRVTLVITHQSIREKSTKPEHREMSRTAGWYQYTQKWYYFPVQTVREPTGILAQQSPTGIVVLLYPVSATSTGWY
jgi:hypothetical protein